MKIFQYLALVLTVVFLPGVAKAGGNTDNEIQYLLSYIGESSCTFIRNGDEHDAKNARKHIEKKYNYLKSRLTTAEEFIEHAASKSSFSGRPYKIKCNEKPTLARNWLEGALKDYRTKN